MWMRVVSSWLCMLLYIWSLLAPVIMPARYVVIFLCHTFWGFTTCFDQVWRSLIFAGTMYFTQIVYSYSVHKYSNTYTQADFLRCVSSPQGQEAASAIFIPAGMRGHTLSCGAEDMRVAVSSEDVKLKPSRALMG